MKNAHDFDGPLFAAVNNQVAADGPETQRLFRQVAAEMPQAGRFGEFAKGLKNLIADEVSRLGVLNLVGIIVPNLAQVSEGGGRDQKTDHRLPWRNSALFCFIRAYASSPGIPSPRSS